MLQMKRQHFCWKDNARRFEGYILVPFHLFHHKQELRYFRDQRRPFQVRAASEWSFVAWQTTASFSMPAIRSVISFIRRNPRSYAGAVLAVISFSPMEYPDYRVGVPMGGSCTRIFSSYNASPADGIETPAHVKTEKHPCDGYSHRIFLHLRPFESVILELPRQRRRGSR